MRRYGFYAALILMAAITGAGLSYKPWQAYVEQRKVAQAHQDEMERVEQRRAELAREKARLDTFAGREAMAREQGFMRKNESIPPAANP